MFTVIKIKKFISKQIIDIKTRGIYEFFRKMYLLAKAIIKFPILTVAIVPCILIRLISPWVIIRIEKFPTSNFGDFLELPSMYHCKKKLEIDFPKTKYIDFVYIDNKDKIYNKQLAKMWKKKFNFFPWYLLYPLETSMKFLPGWQTHSINIFYPGNTKDIDNLIEKYQPLEFTNEEKKYGKKILNEFGLKEQDKFVCLVVRDSAYQKKKISPRYRDWSYHNFRNQNIDNYLLAAEELAKRGYYVFRMGVLVEKPFKSRNQKIIDYANSSLRSDFMDIYIGANCSFCISSGTGFDYLPYCFRKPIAYTSFAPLGDLHTYSEKHLHLVKHHILKKEKRKLSLTEIFSHGVAFAMDSKIFEENGVELTDNTPEEIKDLAIEMIEYTEFNKKLDSQDRELQETFKNLYVNNIKRFDNASNGNNLLLFSNGNKVPFKLHGKIRSRFGTKFLRENKDWLR